MQRPNLIWQCLTITIAALSGTTASAQADAGEVLWKFDLSSVSGAFVTVALDGTIYTADQDRLWAINPDGTVKWTFDEAGGAGGLPVAGGGQP
ncbi:MAG: PQQ-binding-like beta-propeller repeat protein, partial [Armatimonadetes bacterium]|nr:PQQ-binding-like beta-propeller repeat protein [Armatimonadota bacterium]